MKRSLALPAAIVYGDADLDVDYLVVLAWLLATHPNRHDEGCSDP